MDDLHDLDHEHDAHDREEEEEEEEEEVASPGRKKRARDGGKKGNTLRKAPQAPKRFKSSYIMFFMAKQNEIKEALGDEANVTSISKRSAEMWKNLPPEERAHWDSVAAKDKERYMVEKASYTGPWQVPWKRSRKHPSAPKRPMSAFLYFSQGRRTLLKEQNPEMKNTEISRLLGEMWRNSPEEEKRPFIEKEKAEREKYKVAMAEWKKDFEVKQEAERHQQAQQAASGMNAAGVQHPLPYQTPYGEPAYGHSMPYQYHNQYQYGYPAGPYSFPTDGKQPVILGPSGTPVYPNALNSGDDGLDNDALDGNH